MTDFHKPGVCRNGRARANAWDLFQFRPFRVARGRRVSVFGGFADAVCVLFFMRRDFDFFLRCTHTAYCEHETALPHLPLY